LVNCRRSQLPPLKGQITTPKEIRNVLTPKGSDSVIFMVEGDHTIPKPLKKKSFLDFYGALPATRPYPGLEAIREEIHHNIARRFDKTWISLMPP